MKWLENLKAWGKNKLLPWLKKEWLQLGTFAVLCISYAVLPENSGLGIFIGLWIFVIIAVLGYRLFSGKKPETKA
jgi:hypothetical protein